MQSVPSKYFFASPGNVKELAEACIENISADDLRELTRLLFEARDIVPNILTWADGAPWTGPQYERSRRYLNKSAAETRAAETEDDEDLPHTCLECGYLVTLVRPGKWQCDYCEALAKFATEDEEIDA